MADDGQEKTDEPSQYKLDEAKKKGSVTKSMDLNSLLALGAALILMMAAGEQLTHHLFELCRQILSRAGHVNFDMPHLTFWFMSIMKEGLLILSPLFAVLIVVGVLSNILQTGFIFSFSPMKPDFNKVNPVQGFKRLFSMKLLFETIKNLIKLSLFSTILYFSLRSILPDLFLLMSTSPLVYCALFIGYAAKITFKLLAALALIALIDFMFVRWQYIKQMRMSKHEVKEEHKRRDGDPHIKQKRKELQKELRKKGGVLNNVPKADVIVTNPTHLAVLLKYDRQKMIAPIIIGKASGDLVQKVKESAYRYRVPVIEHKLLTRTLYKKTRIDGPIPSDTFIEVARIFRKAYQQKGKLKGMLMA